MIDLNTKWKVYSPATGKEIGEMAETPLVQIGFIYDRSKQAFQLWSQLSISDRLVYLKKLRLLMVEKMDEIAEVISQDTGKVKTEAIVADIMPTIDGIRHIEKHARRSLSRRKVSTPLLFIGKKSYIDYMPRGTVLVISPWNYPLLLAMVPIFSAVAAGNTVIAKPSEITPLVGKCMEELFLEAGFPQGVIQFAHGGKEVGAALSEQNPDYLFFTGSVKTGKVIGEAAAKKLIPCTLELGGKDPMIVFKDANLERAVNAALWGGLTNSGQVCMSVERVYVERPIYAEFLTLLKEKASALKQGTTLSDDVGSMTFPAQVDIVREHLQDALAKGAVLESGMDPNGWNIGNKLFLPPTILSNVNHTMKVMSEETFGPVLPVMPFDNEEEAITLANDSEYGLNSSVWTSDAAKADRVSGRLVTGAVIINDVLVSVANHNMPFGGVKQSGIGRYHGVDGLRIFCHEKAIMKDAGKKKSEIQWYPYKGKYELFLALFKEYFSGKTNWAKFGRLYLKLLKISSKNENERL
ncbi:aldehyde dehydrogenase family protein [Peribacillus cavernae]|uniref:Aldehyde dehydrogenase n=1 Tax=Peribacillus cavernae TaxID=1674310 RepID=A0A433HPH4_9BACI|nr:aldehyde dehydrogenase family protein [Peribacillus cavernae]MDQ0217318.1 acyl-CoA reductase-like NAD-dependent aldehyde dehydrogenase [Peribacillus cavernae]RUQ30221.1 aldehyde dehydrogenase family protein [Peribacillus cavernae]